MIIIDYYSVALSNVFALKEEITEDLLRHMILNSIRYYRKRHQNEFGEIVIAAEGRNNWRKRYFPEYKYKRREDKEDSSHDWDFILDTVSNVLREIDQNFPYKVIKHDDCEADDIVAQLVELTQEFGKHEPVMIISADHDFCQLQRYDNVNQFSPLQKKMVVEKNPEQYLKEHILRGDKGDGIPNVLSNGNTFKDGLRQSTLSKKKLESLLEDPESLGEDVYAHYIRNRTLIDLRNTPQYIKDDITTLYEADKKVRPGSVMNYLIKNRCKQLTECAGDFVNA